MLTPTDLKTRLDEAGIAWSHVCTGRSDDEIAVHLTTDDRAELTDILTRMNQVPGVARAALRPNGANNRLVLVTTQP